MLHVNDIAVAGAIGPTSLQLLGMHAVTGCDTVSYPFKKGKLTALSKLQQGDFPELYSIVGEETATHENLMITGQNFFAALYGQPNCSSINTARYMIYTEKNGKPPFVKSLPPTDKNLLLHMLRAHCQALLWEAADKQNATSLCITEFGWEWLDNVPSHVIACGPPAPPDLMKSVSCQCRAAGKACSEANCSCLTASLSCTTCLSNQIYPQIGLFVCRFCRSCVYPLVYVGNKIIVITHLRNVLYVIIVGLCKYVQTLNITFSAHFFRKRQPVGYFAGSGQFFF